MRFFFFGLFVFVCFTSITAVAKNCVPDASLKEHAVLIENASGEGVGSGVLYQGDILLTTHTNIMRAKKGSLYIPAYDTSINQMEVLYSAPRPDLAVVKLAQPVSATEPLVLARKVLRAEPITFLSFPFNNKKRLGTARSKLNTHARFSHDTRLLYFNATLDDWAFYGDNGGSFFNCKGELVGLHFGAIHTGAKPEHIYGMNMRALEDGLKAAGVPVRREY